MSRILNDFIVAVPEVLNIDTSFNKSLSTKWDRGCGLHPATPAIDIDQVLYDRRDQGRKLLCSRDTWLASS